MAEHRRDRVAHLIRGELASLLLREARDPRLQAVTITDVRVTADLRLARVQFRTLTPEATPRAAQVALRRATPFLRGALGRALGMRVTPELRFEYDTTPDTARRLDALLDVVRPGETAEDDEEDGVVIGILLVDKPEGMSSAGAIRVLKGRLGGAKVGHLGTLDPFASGLLPLCVGEATKVARYLLLERKAYTGTIRLGVETDTLDRTGQVTVTAAVPSLSPAAVAAAASRFLGSQWQVPPMFSALKREGVPLYKLARRGIAVERAAREIEIRQFELTLRDAERLEFSVECSKGTYVRVLAADLGRALGTVGHLESLRRTRVGAFDVEAAHAPDALAAMSALPLIPVREALTALRVFTLDAEALVQLRRGQQAPLRHLAAPTPGEAALVVDERGGAAALVEAGTDGWRVARMLAS